MLCEGLARKKANRGGDGRAPGRGVPEEQRWGLWLGWGRQRAEELSAPEPEGHEPRQGIREAEALSIGEVGAAGKLLAWAQGQP